MTTVFDSSGLRVARYDELVADMVSAAESLWGESINTDDDQLLGHWIRQLAIQLAELNELLQEVYDAQSIYTAVGARLDHLLGLIGLERQDAAASTATLTYTVSAATTVPVGHQVRTAANVVFATDEELVFVGAGSADVAATCTVVGPSDAAIGEICIPVEMLYGVTSVTNASAAIPGRYRETDGPLRERHTLATATSGDGDLASLYETVSAVSGVDSVYAADDTATHSVSVSVIGGTDDDVAAAIAGQITSGIPTLGSTSVDWYSDVTHQTKTIKFTRASDIACYVDMTLTVNPALYHLDGESQIRDALLEAWDYGIHDTVQYLRLMGPVFSVSGVTINSIYLGTAPGPTGTADLPMSTAQRGTLDETDITIAYTI